MIRVFKSATDVLINKYDIFPFDFLTYVNASELVGRAQQGDIIVFNSLSDIGDDNRVLVSLRHIFAQSAFLLVLDNKELSCALIKKVSGKNKIVENEDAFASKAPVILQTLKYVLDEKDLLGLPHGFDNLYWDYELGNKKVSDICSELNISKMYFYKLCAIYETSVDYYLAQNALSVSIIQTPKKHLTDYSRLVGVLQEYMDGLTFGAVRKVMSEFSICWFDVWRLLRAFYKSRFYYELLKENPEIKQSQLASDLATCMKGITKNPKSVIEAGFVPEAVYSDYDNIVRLLF